MFKVNNKDTRTTLVTSCCCLYYWLWTFFTPSSVSIVNFEQENAIWEGSGSSTLNRHDEYKHHPKLVLKKFSLSNKIALIKISIVYNDSKLLHLSSETLGLKATLVLQLLAMFHVKSFLSHSIHPVGIYLLKVNNRNTKTRCEICSKLTTKTPERCHWCRSSVFIVNFGHISHFVLEFLLLTLNR